MSPRRVALTSVVSGLLLFPLLAEAYTLNVLASLNPEADYPTCSANYTGVHAAQYREVVEADNGKVVGVEGKLYKNGFLSTAIVSQCNAGGVLPLKKLFICETDWTHPCVNPSGPHFQAGSFAMGVVDWSDEERILCVDH